MRIYSEVVIDMDTLLVISEKYTEYSGDVAECKFGGGAGGGAPAGAVDYPAYMKTVHNDWLDGTGVDTMTYSIVDLMNTAMTGSSPYSGFVALDIDTVFLGSGKAVSDYIGVMEQLDVFRAFVPATVFPGYMTTEQSRVDALATDTISTATQAESDLIIDEINTKIIPRFHAGMLDINAVQSSAFVLGDALINAAGVKSIAKFDADLRHTVANIKMQMYSAEAEVALKRTQLDLEWHRLASTLSVEISRIYSAARHETDLLYADIEMKDRTFNLSLYQYGSNVLSSIAGSAVSADSSSPRPSALGGAISGALMGAGMGAMAGAQIGSIGGPWGAAGGAILGGLAGYLNS